LKLFAATMRIIGRGSPKPFSFGEYTYATDGRVAIRVPRSPDVAEDDEAGLKIDALFAKVPPCEFKVAPAIEFPPREEADDDCDRCEGRGLRHDCPTCHCVCRHCEGTGKEPIWYEISFELEGVHFGGKYLYRLKGLPDLKFGVPKDGKPMRFSFDGGDGLIMPMRGSSRRIVKLDARKRK
jgi:hypothetical protein